jgi:hypothetical protein
MDSTITSVSPSLTDLADGHFHLPDAAGDFGSNFVHDGSKKLSIFRLLTI